MGGSCLKVRRATAQDLEALLSVERDSFADPFPFSFFVELLRAHPRTFLVACHGGQVAGYIAAIPEESEGHILSIAVASSMRRERIGTVLVNEVAKELLGMGISSVYIEVRKSNQSGRAFYRHLVFMKNYVVRGYYHDGEDAIVMIRRPSKSDSC